MQKKWMFIGCFFVLAVMIIQHTNVGVYIQQVKRATQSVQTTGTSRDVEERSAQDPLMERILNEAKVMQEAPVDARVDSVWKAIPAYNGIVVDIENTYRLSKGMKPDQPLQFVLQEVPVNVNLNDLGPYPIYRGNPGKKMVSLMINVAWGNEFIQPMLDILEQENVLATFFFDGSWLSKNLDVAREIQKRGHEMSNHAYSHPNMSTLSRTKAIEEIVKTQQLLEQELGVTNPFFAPPSGDFDQETVIIAHELKLKTILWTLDTVDWRNPPPQQIIRKIDSLVEPGSLILMHPTKSSSQALQGMIQAVKEKGLQLGTVSETLSPRRSMDLIYPLDL